MLAHSLNKDRVGHSLPRHLLGVAKMARDMADKFGARELGYWAGLWHDLGKFSPAFQEYIRDPSKDHRRGPDRDHATAGALHAQATLGSREALALTFPIAGHHSGLADHDELVDRLKNSVQQQRTPLILRAASQQLPSLVPPSAVHLPAFVETTNSPLTLDLFIRMLYSALTDADFMDTERHFTPEYQSVRLAYPSQESLWPKLETYIAELAQRGNGVVHQLRQEVYRDCLRAAEQAPGIFRLTVPTGGGKTLSSMAFALRHAMCHSLDRVIVAIPYTSIIEQTADQYAKVFGGAAVLEHHSAVDVGDPHEDLSERHVRARLASQNWDAPVVVTTTVQLFDSIFANRSSRLRKLHNLVRSVLVLDEVQTLPPGFLEPVLDVLRELTANYGTTVVLCSATLPAFQDTPYLKGLPKMREIVTDPQRHFDALKRVRYTLPHGKVSWDEIAGQMAAEPQCMAVVNTKNDALALLEALDDPEAMHLSTLLCGAHRRDVLAQVRERLQKGLPCRLVATQVVEAGVDLDFPVVFRALGPLDRIVQTAGRCNREGKLEYGRVVVFEPAEGSTPPGVYRAGTDVTQRLLQSVVTDLDSPAVHRLYYDDWFSIIDQDSKHIQEMRRKLHFAQVAEAFRMIDDDTVPVVVPYVPGNWTKDTIVSLRREGRMSRELVRQLQPYLVGVRQREQQRMEREGLLLPVTEGLWEWMGEYDSVVGIGRGVGDPERLFV